jgi:hypothetical protein
VKYLKTEESEGIQHQQMKERLKKEYTRRLRMILKSELNTKNKITAITALDVPVFRQFKSTKDLTLGIALHAPYTVTTE